MGLHQLAKLFSLFLIMTIYNCKGAWYDRQGRRHNFEIESDRAERSFIKELVEARYPTNRVVINNVSQKR